MKKEELKAFVITKEFTFDNLVVELRELTTKEYFKLHKVQSAGDNEHLFDFFNEVLPNLIVKHNIEDATNNEVGSVICESMIFFSKLVEEYSNFLGKRQQKKK